MATPVLPRAQSAIAGRELPAPTWYDFFRDLLAFVQANEGNTAQIESILARLDELEENQPGQFTIAGLMSVEVDGTPAGGVVQVHLFNDSDAPGNTYGYGTGPDGTKGWFALADAIAGADSVVQTVGVDGVSTFALENDQAIPGPLRYYRTDAAGAKGWSGIYPGEVPTDLATYLVDENGDFLVDENGNFLTGDQPDALVTDLQWVSDSAGLHVMGSDGIRQTLVANNSKIVTVYTLDDLPRAIAGVITLANNTSYFITTAIDLLGARIVCGTNNSLWGRAFSASSLTSTGLDSGDVMITAASSLKIEDLALSAPTGTLFSLNDGATGNLFLTGAAIVSTPTIGTAQNYGNIVIENTVVLNSANWTVTGTIGSFATFRTLLGGRAGQTTLIFPAGLTVTRRISILYSSVETPATGTGIDASASMTIPDECYNLDNTVFSGSGTPITGIDYTSNKALFFNCTGINNSSTLCQYSMTGNATATVIGGTGTFVKVAGTTTASSLNQKFSTATTQRATYTGAFTANCRVVAFASMTSGNNQTLRMRVAKNGTTIAESNTLFKTTGTGEASAVGCQVITSLAPTDFVELFVTNDTAVQNITVSDLNFTITRL